jgi:Ca2+-binding EF-hand superfamily protein
MHLPSPPSLKLSVNFYIFLEEENFNKSFFRIIDTNGNGVISKKELNEFNPCP